MRKLVGIFGSAEASPGIDIAAKARIVGEAVASSGAVILTGACTGVTYEAVLGAREKGGTAIGVSPARDRAEHVERFGYPLEGFDFMLFTGFGNKGRNVINVRSCDACVFMSGGPGTLNEFTIAYDEGKRIGVLAGSGGISDSIRDIVAGFYKRSDAVIVYEPDPSKLVKKLLDF